MRTRHYRNQRSLDCLHGKELGRVIVTIDGPAGAGKSTVARALADRLGFLFLDTGAMYRVVTLMASRLGVTASQEHELQCMLTALRIGQHGARIFLDDEDVSAEIRTTVITQGIKPFADHPLVRTHLAREQRRIAEGRNLVTEGRDQGTEVFPDAECKFFLTASDEARARRRVADLARRGEQHDFATVLAAQRERDAQDRARTLGGLRTAPDARLVDTSELSIEDVVTILENAVRARFSGHDD